MSQSTRSNWSRASIRMLFVVMSLLTGGQVTANVQSVTVAPGSKNVAVSSSTASLSLAWTPSANHNMGFPQTATVSSNAGEFRVGNTIVGTVARQISGTVIVPDGVTAILAILEVVRVPVEVVARAHQLGAASLTYQRTFRDSVTLGSATTSVLLPITGRLGTHFNITRLSLHFDDRSVQRVVERGEAPKAQVDITFAGSGVLRAVWELATSDSTSGSRVFLQIRTVRQFLGSQGRVTLTSPELPTQAVGSHRVRFRIEQPQLITDPPPEVQYYVGGDVAADAKPVPATLRIGDPESSSIAGLGYTLTVESTEIRSPCFPESP